MLLSYLVVLPFLSDGPAVLSCGLALLSDGPAGFLRDSAVLPGGPANLSGGPAVLSQVFARPGLCRISASKGWFWSIAAGKGRSVQGCSWQRLVCAELLLAMARLCKNCSRQRLVSCIGLVFARIALGKG